MIFLSEVVVPNFKTTRRLVAVALLAIAGLTPLDLAGQEKFWCGVSCSSSDWDNQFNWDFLTLPASGEIATIDGLIDPTFAGGAGVDAVDVTAEFASLILDAGATLNLGSGTDMFIEGSNRSLIGYLVGSGVLNMTDDASVEIGLRNGLWVGRLEGGGGTINMSGDSQLRLTGGGPLVFSVNEPGVLNITDNALVEGTGDRIWFARSSANLGAGTVTYNQSGGTIRTPWLTFGSAIDQTIASMSGGVIDAGRFTWSAPAGSKFNYSGGVIHIDGDQTSMIDEPWFNASTPVFAFFDGTRTTIRDSPVFAADFDFDGDVDHDDLRIWERGVTTLTGATQASGDADGDGAVTGRDLLVWQGEFMSPGSSPRGAAVPEPTAALLFLIALSIVGITRKPTGASRG